MPSKGSAVAALLLIGGCYGIVLSFAYAFGSMVVPESRVDDAMGLITASYAFPMFISTYIMTWLMNRVFKTSLHNLF